MSVLRKPRLIIGLLLVAAGWIALLADAVPAAHADEPPFEVRIAIRNHHFEPAEIEVPDKRRLKRIVNNEDATPGFRRLPSPVASR